MKTIGIETAWIPLASLNKWDAPCQREETSLQHDIAKNFDPSAFGVIHVFQRDGKYYVIDGQNRTAALRNMGFNGSHAVPCINHGEISDAEAAAIFRDVNNFKGLKPYNIFMSKFMRGENDQVAIVETLNHVGLVVGPGGSNGVVSAVRALERVHRPNPKGEPDPEALRRTLQTILAAWGPKRSALQGSIIVGIGQVYLRDKKRINDEEMVAHLARRAGGPEKLIGDARGARDMFGGALATVISDLVVAEYNHNRRSRDRMLKPFRS